VLVSVETHADFDVETDGNLVVFLDTELDDPLRQEGLAREVIGRVNRLRKEAGLAVEQRISLRLGAEDGLLGGALEVHAGLIAEETLTVDYARAAEPLAGGPWNEETLSSGDLLRVSLQPV